MAHAELDRLQACLNFALDTLRKEMDDSQLPPLSQHSPVEHPLDDPNFLPSARLFEARRLSLACMGELKNLIQSPLDRCFEDKFSIYGVACIDMLIRTGIVDYLADVPNPSQGVPVAELAANLELDSQKIIPILRCSAANGWVRESHDSSFALNRCSRTLIKGQPGWKLVSLPGFMTLVETVSHWVTESEWKISRSPLQTAFQIAYKTPLSAFSWLVERPELHLHAAGHFQMSSSLPGYMTLIETVSHWVTESEWKLSRSPLQTAFQIAYKTPLLAFSWFSERPELCIHAAGHYEVFGNTSTPSIIADYPWAQLETPVIVDCAGGKGGLVSAILDAHPSFEGIVQDMEDMVAVTGSIMQELRPIQIESGVLKVEAHDLFQPQPRIGNEYSFILRHIIHNWPDKEAVTILSHLARALGPKSKILVVDIIAVEVHDLFQPQPRIGNEYSFILRHIMHDWPDEEAATILSHLARALGPKSKILVIDDIAVPNVDATATMTINSLSHERADYIIPSHFGSASKSTSGSSMHMMAMFNSRERSMDEWEQLVRVAGLRITNVYPLRAQDSIIECALDTHE
ncbi:hypothetical protein AZE42_02418 [Rhizopogon vesiculosus]|uniref:O-methyltransferase C-terminal domain-containing protein n=2 Tax=Rhizopogon vesiculosus TaxID=180088 RepID=A0A1J8PWM6_9AGAM|nr:hypothetical protein AZE42_02418 [Rhizopogon vesiculosus]